MAIPAFLHQPPPPPASFQVSSPFLGKNFEPSPPPPQVTQFLQGLPFNKGGGVGPTMWATCSVNSIDKALNYRAVVTFGICRLTIQLSPDKNLITNPQSCSELNYQHHPKLLASKLSSQKMRVTEAKNKEVNVTVLILWLVVGLWKGVSCLINIHGLLSRHAC